MERSAMDTFILPDQPAREGAPCIIDAGDLPGTEEIFLDKSYGIFDRLSEHSDNRSYPHTFFIRTF